MDRRKSNAYTQFVVFLGFLFIVAPLLFFSGPYVEAKFLPVYSDIHPIEVKREGDAITFDVVGTKVRPCEYLSTSVLAGKPGDYLELVQIDFPETGGKGTTRPPGAQSLNLWRIHPVNDGDELRILLRHRCHSAWDVTLQLGPWPVDASK